MAKGSMKKVLVFQGDIFDMFRYAGKIKTLIKPFVEQDYSFEGEICEGGILIGVYCNKEQVGCMIRGADHHIEFNVLENADSDLIGLLERNNWQPGPDDQATYRRLCYH